MTAKKDNARIDSYNKNFSDWHRAKTKINNQSEENKPFFYEREIWWVSVGKNIGFEEDGKNENFIRPVLILRKFNKYTFLGVPLTSSEIVNKYRIPFSYKDEARSVALISQIRVFDSKRDTLFGKSCGYPADYSNRLGTKDGMISDKGYKLVQQKITEIINQKARK